MPAERFDLADYRNGEQVADLLEGLGPERGFPVALLDSSPELTPEESEKLWTDYLKNSRVVRVRRDQVKFVVDYCELAIHRHLLYRFGPKSRGIELHT